MRSQVTLAILLLPLLLPMVGNAKDPLPDPTRPPSSLAYSGQLATPNPNAKLDLRAIFFSNGRRLAVINDQRLREQDQIGTARVLEIMADRVRLTRDGGEFELTLIHLDIKTPPPREQPSVNGSATIPTRTVARTSGPDAAASTAINAPAHPLEAWGGPSTASPALSNTHADSRAAPSTDPPGTHLGGDWNDPSSTLQTDGDRPSGIKTPSWVDSLLGEGKKK